MYQRDHRHYPGEVAEVEVEDNNEVVTRIVDNSENSHCQGDMPESLCTDITSSVATFIAHLRSCSIPTSVVQSALQESRGLVGTILDSLEAKMSPMSQDIREGKLPSIENVDAIQSFIESMKYPFKDLQTEYLQTKYLHDCGALVLPQEMDLGQGYKAQQTE